MRKGQLVEARTPRGTVKRGRFVQEHKNHNGTWLEIQPVDTAGKAVKGVDTFRSRPASVTAV